ncbi:hypothetical protein TWF730_007111 [Orbilia blumenaviensis]|uniref:Uncharacterized protein n=1 Tax=Orbilia blumenaviensis TaxID=1796055 RepID=A0AAV9VJ65_9PEZI
MSSLLRCLCPRGSDTDTTESEIEDTVILPRRMPPDTTSATQAPRRNAMDISQASRASRPRKSKTSNRGRTRTTGEAIRSKYNKPAKDPYHRSGGKDESTLVIQPGSNFPICSSSAADKKEQQEEQEAREEDENLEVIGNILPEDIANFRAAGPGAAAAAATDADAVVTDAVVTITTSLQCPIHSSPPPPSPPPPPPKPTEQEEGQIKPTAPVTEPRTTATAVVAPSSLGDPLLDAYTTRRASHTVGNRRRRRAREGSHPAQFDDDNLYNRRSGLIFPSREQVVNSGLDPGILTSDDLAEYLRAGGVDVG